MSGNLSTYKTEFSDIIRAIIDTVLFDMNVCLPAKIESYNSDTQYANVQIQLLKGFIDGSTQKIAIIPNVPVVHPRANGGAAFIHMPLKPGDDVTLVFSQRSLDNWKISKDGLANPGDTRKFHIADCYALIGGSAIPNSFTPQTDDAIEIVNGQMNVQIYPNGNFAVKNDTDELINLLDEITAQIEMTNETLAVDTVNTIFGPQQLLHFETYEAIYNQLGLLKTKLDSFKV